jgi:folate-binding protein YgfZ
MALLFQNLQPNENVQWNWMTLIGPDAQDFLHRVTTVNTKSLSIGQGASGCFLTAQGKIRSYFTLWNFDKDSYAFEFDAGTTGNWKKSLLEAIDQYTFAEKITLTDLSEKLAWCWIFPEANELERAGILPLETDDSVSTLAPHTFAIDEEIRISHHGKSDFGRPWLTAWGRPARLAQWLERSFENSKQLEWAEIEAWRISEVRPRVDHEITENTIPLELGLRNAVAENKGCYPGQEVLERIMAMGSPPRRLVRIEGEGEAPELGSTILNLADPPGTVGEVTSVSVWKNEKKGYSALGLVRKIHAKEGLEVRFSNSQNSPASGPRGVIAQVAAYT